MIKKFVGLIGVVLALCSVYMLVSGSMIAIAVVNMSSSDYLLVGFTLFVIGSLLAKLGEADEKASKAKDNKTQPAMPGSN